jgi:orotate phosphoribosyltransferase
MSDFIDLINAQDLQTNDNAHTTKSIAQKTAEILINTKSVLFNARDPFTLKSGRQSPVYIDCRRLISFVEERDFLMNAGAKIIADNVGLQNIDYVAGGETAGIPYGAFIAERLKKPMIYVRKQPKGYGRMAQIEGHLPEKENSKTILIEDLQTDGGSKKVFIDALREAGTTIEHAFVVFHYGIFPACEHNMQEMGITLHALATWWDVLDVAKKNKYFDAQTLSSVESFLKAPDTWEKT